MGWLPPSLTTSRCASVVLVQATNGKDGNYEYRYDDWCGSGKVCFPGSRGVDEKNMGHREYSFLLRGGGVPWASRVLGGLAAPGGLPTRGGGERGRTGRV